MLWLRHCIQILLKLMTGGEKQKMFSMTEIIGWILAAFVGGSGLVGLIMMKPKHDIENRIQRDEDDRKRLDKVDEYEKVIESIQEEQTVQCYCILACLKGLAEQGCNGPVHEGIDRMERHLNKKAHGQ